jgi:predicted metalloprotease with PDZ domain
LKIAKVFNQQSAIFNLQFFRMNYILSFEHANSRFLHIEAVATGIKEDITEVQVPSWRPGRYELGNFAKNVRNFTAFDEKGRQLETVKRTKDLWEVRSKGVSEIHVKYEYHAAELNAGSTFLDETQLYVNPVNCLAYLPGRISEECRVKLEIPDNWRVACALKKEKGNVLVAKDFDRLADSPFIAGPALKHNMFVLDGVEFHLWFQGECTPEWPRIISDFFIFISEQMAIFGSFPATEFHFLFQILPTRFYHGVEHTESTVIALGPSYKLMTDRAVYNDFLGVSCHELFHAWNIKAIRPAELMPYDFTRENYSRLGYVCEGVTTYYGDYLLFRSGVWSEEEFWPAFNERLEKHFESHARHFLSVADASFDTWLDGYVPGAPHRKTSIYHEGSLLAFVTDIFIRKNTSNAKNLDHVMRRLWKEFALKDKGYTEAHYMKLVEQEAGADFSYYKNNFFYKANSYEPALREALDYIGCDLIFAPSRKPYEHQFGFKVAEPGGITRVTDIYYGSPAEKQGLAVGDEIIGINRMQVKADLAEWMRYFQDEVAEIVVASSGRIKTIMLRSDGKTWYSNAQVRRRNDVTPEQERAWTSWSGKKY